MRRVMVFAAALLLVACTQECRVGEEATVISNQRDAAWPASGRLDNPARGDLAVEWSR